MTPRQIEALEAAFERGSPWAIQGRVSNCGGAFARMVDELETSGLLIRRERTISVKGLRALANVYRSRTDAGPHRNREVAREKLAKVEAALVERGSEEEEASRIEAAMREQAAARTAKHRERRIGGFRELFTEMTQGPDEFVSDAADSILRLDDDGLLAFVDRVIDRDSAI